MKKFLRYIFTIALFGAMCFGGYKYITDWGKPEDVDITELTVNVNVDNNLLGTYHSQYDDLSNDQRMDVEDCVLELFRDAEREGKEYLITDSASSAEWKVYSVTEDEMNVYLDALSDSMDWSGTGLEGINTKLTDIEKTKENIKLLIYGLEKNYSTFSDGVYYGGLYGNSIYRALGQSIYDPESNGGGQGLLAKSFKKDGLILDVKDVDVQSIYINKAKMLSLQTAYALVKVELKCVENSGKYKDLEWVPNIGETENVRFVISYESVIVPSFDSKKVVDLYDIAYFK